MSANSTIYSADRPPSKPAICSADRPPSKPARTKEAIAEELRYCGLRLSKSENLFARLVNPFYILYDLCRALKGYDDWDMERPVFPSEVVVRKMAQIHAVGKFVTSLIGTFLWTTLITFIVFWAKLGAAAAFTATMHTLGLPATTVLLGALGSTPVGLIILGSILLFGLGTAVSIGLYQQKAYQKVLTNASLDQPPRVIENKQAKKPPRKNVPSIRTDWSRLKALSNIERTTLLLINDAEWQTFMQMSPAQKNKVFNLTEEEWKNLFTQKPKQWNTSLTLKVGTLADQLGQSAKHSSSN